jgi:simple sugar transport system ATP-binding protein
VTGLSMHSRPGRVLDDAPVVLRMEHVGKDYRGVPAVSDVSFDVRRGEVHALLGENGAGKSTLTKIMAGAVTRASGTMFVGDEPVDFQTPAEALSGGVVMVYQESSLVPTLTVAQNVYLGDERFFNRLRGLFIAAQQFLQSLGFNVDPAEMVSALGAAQRQMVEIARAVHKQAKVIIFDEPTASLTPEEKHHFFGLIERLRDRGMAIVFITHVLEEALTLADRITVLRDGQHVVTGPADQFDRQSLVQAMVGRTLSGELYGVARRARPYGEKVLSVQNLSMQGIVKNASFSVYAGQVTGMFGLVGSGRTEMTKVIAGVYKRDFFHGGEVRYKGRSVRYRVPRQAVKEGIVYVTEDRKLEGFFDEMSIDMNIVSGLVAGQPRQPLAMTMKRFKAAADEWREKLQVRSINGDARVIELSGGNQQKVVIAKALAQKPKLVIFDEPTRGVDVGTIAEIHRFINDLADEGLAVIVISSYLPEVLNLSDRILVCRSGRVVEEFAPESADERMILHAAIF